MTPTATYALITGASGGIGYELAQLFARDGSNLVLVARSGDRLAAIAGELQNRHSIQVMSIAMDLTGPAAAQNLFDQLQQRSIAIDILVNNAGFGIRGEFAQISPDDTRGMVQLNVMALTELTRLLLPRMLESKSGRILNVASTAAFQPGPLMAVYYATKAYVLSLSEALSNELRGSGVGVTCLCPGPTDTGFQHRAGTVDSILLRAARPMDAATVARDGYRGLMAGKTLVISGFRNRMLAESVRLAPRKLVTAISRKVLENLSR